MLNKKKLLHLMFCSAILGCTAPLMANAATPPKEKAVTLPKLNTKLHHVMFCVQPENYDKAVNVWRDMGLNFVEIPLQKQGIRMLLDWSAGIELVTLAEQEGTETARYREHLKKYGEGVCNVVVRTDDFKKSVEILGKHGATTTYHGNMDVPADGILMEEADFKPVFGMELSVITTNIPDGAPTDTPKATDAGTPPKLNTRLNHVNFCVRPENLERAANVWRDMGLNFIEMPAEKEGLKMLMDWSAGIELVAPSKKAGTETARIQAHLDKHGEGVCSVVVRTDDFKGSLAILAKHGATVTSQANKDDPASGILLDEAEHTPIHGMEILVLTTNIPK